MRKNLLITTLLTIAIVSSQTSQSQQVCNSGKLDPRAAFVLQFMPDRTLEEERATPVDLKRKMSAPPDDNPVPADKMQQVKITADSLVVTIFRPDNAGNKKLPVIIDYHGGAFFLPYQSWMYGYSYALANDLQAIVFSVDYRVAPEYKFPIPVNDCYNTFKWVLANAQNYGGDTLKIILNGASAGANLAAAVTLMAKDEGLDKNIKMSFLFCPAMDNPMNGSYPSLKENEKGYGITKNTAIWATENYSGNIAKDTSDFRMFPIKAKNFKGLAPTLVYTAEFDILRDEGAAYANKLKNAGVTTLFRCFPGQLHVLMGLPPDAKEFQQISNDMKGFMKKYL